MKKKATLLALLFAIAFTSFAASVSLPTAQRIAASFLQSKMGQTPEISLINFADRNAFSGFYVFGNDHCFVIIAKDDCVPPVLGFSTETAFGLKHLPENILAWLSDYDNEIVYIRSNHFAASAEIASEWDDLLNGRGLTPKSRSSVSPLILTRWDQDGPFNSLCPAHSSGPNGHVYTGCVATAMAQVMNYWEHPVKGSGSHTYTHSTYGQQSANFGTTTYDWDNMKNIYLNDYTTNQANAVATLMYHCGVSVDMSYNINGSGAYSSDVPYALKTYFNYANSTSFQSKSNYSNQQWINKLKNELDAARPVYYSGQGSGGGHAFVCDGYNENNYFHFNWGWSGSCDGYYLIGSLNPGPGGSGSGSSGQYNSSNAAIFNCAPNTPSINAPANVSVTVNSQNVTVTWNSVSNAVSYKLYRDGNLLAASITGTSYTDSNVPYGQHSYYVKSVKSDGTMSLKSNTAIADVHFPGPVATNLQANLTGNNASLSWSAPASENATLMYTSANSPIGGVGGYSNGIYWAQRYPASTLSSYAGMAINKVSVYIRSTGSYTLYVCKGNEATYTEVLYQTSYNATSTGWRDFNIASPVVMDYTNDLWVIMYAAGSVSYPASYTSYTGTGAEHASYYSPTGDYWLQWKNNGQTCSWLFKTYLTDGTYTYKLYRNNNAIANNLSGTSYTDSNLASGNYTYYVTTNYYGGESDPSNSVSIQVGTVQSYTISVTANPSTGGTATGGGTFNQGETCTVTASANADYTFTNWTENGTQVSTNASYSFTVTGNRNLVANFTAQTYTITASASPADGGSVSGDGTFTHGESCTLTATPNTGYTFTNWTENGTQVSTNASYSFTVTGNRNLVANFTIQSYTITASASPADGGSVSGAGDYDYGETCTLSATANTGYNFVNWTENGTQVSTNASYSFTVTGNQNLVANFTAQSYTITASASPADGGSVSGAGGYDYGETCTLVATANTGYNFLRWTKNGTQVSSNPTYTFSVVESAAYVAQFTEQSYTIAASADPADGGSVSGGDSYNYGEICTLSASANTGYNFVNWTENGTQVSTNANYSFTVTGNRSLVAHFALQSYEVMAATYPDNAGTITGAGTYHYGETATLHVEPNENYIFDCWKEKNGNVVSESPTYTFFVTESIELVAHLIFFDGIEESSLPFEIFPNPVTDQLQIHGRGITSAKIFNALGQLLDTKECEDGESVMINVNTYEPSTYILVLYTKNGIVAKQFIKK